MTKPRIGPLRNADLKKAILDYVKNLDAKELVIDKDINPFEAIVHLSWIDRYIVVDKRKRSIISEAGGWGFKSLDTARSYIDKTTENYEGSTTIQAIASTISTKERKQQ